MSLLLENNHNKPIDIDNIIDCEHSLQREKFLTFAQKF